MNYDIRFALDEEIDDLVKLSEDFSMEDCCNGINADDYDYFKDKKVAVCLVNNKVIAYCYGNIELSKDITSYLSDNAKCFYLEEMYVSKRYRSLGIGKELFKFIEEYAKNQGCKLLKLSAVSKNYNKLFKFYIDELGMQFISAFLVKSI